MKKILFIILSIFILMGVTSCSGEVEKEKTEEKTKEEIEIGVSPYNLSQDAIDLIRTLNLEDRVNIISFKAPENAKNIKANIYNLDKNGRWKLINELKSSLKQGSYSKEEDLEGSFSMIISEDYYTEKSNINVGTSIHAITLTEEDYPIDNIIFEGDYAASSHFLDEFQKIELNKEIPVAMMIKNSNTDLADYDLKSFFSPSELYDMDYVQAVTLVFTD